MRWVGAVMLGRVRGRAFSSASGALATPPPTKAGWRPIRKIMAANRGEIAIRIFRAATELDIKVIITSQSSGRCALRDAGGPIN